MHGYEKCFACGRKTGKSPELVDTRDGQLVYIGSECFKLVQTAGEEGYQPPLGGPRLWLIRQGKKCVDSPLHECPMCYRLTKKGEQQ